ncbi:MAG: alpha/beta fold hydrolase [Anaerolineae bacterium]|nr:alpha/beta fold hydrolase [Anaerolineae bacterium]
MTRVFPIRRGAEPFFLDGGDVGCVCTHGFTGSPDEMRWLGEYLNGRGLTVFGPRLAGHGTDPTVMNHQRWIDWYEDVQDGVALLRARCRKVFALGLSMGGTLSLRIGAEGLVDGVVALAAPVRLTERLMPHAHWIKYIKPYYAKDGWPGDLNDRVRAVQQAEGRDEVGKVDYGVMPTESIGQLYALMHDVYEHLHTLTAPLLLVYSKADQTVPYDNLALIADRVGSRDLVVQTLEYSDHVLTQETERETVYDRVWDFLSARLD